MDVVKYIFYFFTVLTIYLNILATISIFRTTTLNNFQKYGQVIFSWVIPIIGSKLVLKLLSESEPEATRWIPQRGHSWLIVAGTYHETLHGRENSDNTGIINTPIDNSSSDTGVND